MIVPLNSDGDQRYPYPLPHMGNAPRNLYVNI